MRRLHRWCQQALLEEFSLLFLETIFHSVFQPRWLSALLSPARKYMWKIWCAFTRVKLFRSWNVWLPMKRMLEMLWLSLFYASVSPTNSRCLSLWNLMLLFKWTETDDVGNPAKGSGKKVLISSEWHEVSGLLPSEALWIIKHPSSPKVTITNFSFGNLNNMETSAAGVEEASVHACETWETENLRPQILKIDVRKTNNKNWD